MMSVIEQREIVTLLDKTQAAHGAPRSWGFLHGRFFMQ